MLNISNLHIYIFAFVQTLSMKKKVLNRIKAVLAEEGKTNKELADQLKVAEPTVSRWCTNKQQPSLEMLYDIAKVLKRDVKDFLVSSK
jgi:putative transcriptional regulator